MAIKAHVRGEIQARLQVGEEEGGLLMREAHLYGGAVQDGAAVVPAAVQLLGAHHRGGQGAVGTQGHTMREMVSEKATSEMDQQRGRVLESWQQGMNKQKWSARTGNNWRLLP